MKHMACRLRAVRNSPGRASMRGLPTRGERNSHQDPEPFRSHRAAPLSDPRRCLSRAYRCTAARTRPPCTTRRAGSNPSHQLTVTRSALQRGSVMHASRQPGPPNSWSPLSLTRLYSGSHGSIPGREHSWKTPESTRSSEIASTRSSTPNGRTYHYIGNPRSKSGASVPRGVVRRLKEAHFRRTVVRVQAFGVEAYK